MRFRICCLIVFLLLSSVSIVNAQDDVGPAVPIADAKTKTGAFKALLADRSPLSGLKDIAKRVGLKATEVGDDYDLSKETFYVYVPKEAGDDGKYGLMVGLCFKEYGHPALAWPAVLDKKHLIWIGVTNNGDERAAAQRIGLLLDATSNIEKNWSIDPDRVYLSMNAAKGPALGTALFYPDVFTGNLGSYAAHWFIKLKTAGTQPLIYDTDDFPRPAAKNLDQAKSQSRFFTATRDEGSLKVTTDLVKKAYSTAGFKYASFIKVPEADMGHYINYSAGWFEQGIDFLDAPLAEIRAARKPHTKPKVNPITPSASSPQ
jgi:hypothetical protein